MDLKLYKPSGDFPYRPRDIEILDPSLLDYPKVKSRSEILANKVLKYFLTNKGTDSFEPEYGTTVFNQNQVSEEYLQVFKLEIKEEIARCIKYFQAREKQGEKISRIILKDVRLIKEHDKTPDKKTLEIPWVEIVMEIITTKGNRASIDVVY